MNIIKTLKLTNTEDGHNKVWEGTLFENGDVMTAWGKIGYDLQSKLFPNSGEEFLNKKLNEKVKKGYKFSE